MSNIDKPKYQKLKEYIVETIVSDKLSAGEKFYSENELAERFQISRHTIRQALGELVNEGWLYRVQGKGTFVNRRPGEKSKTSRNIGVVTTYINDYIFPSIIKGVYDVLSENNYNISLGCTSNQHEKERSCLENLLQQDVAGLIIEPTKSALPNPNIDIYKEFSRKGIPILFIHGSYRELDYSYIVEDDIQAGYLATQHLIDQGHQRLGGIFKMDDIQGHHRFSGFQKAHLEAKLQTSDSRILWFETDNMEEMLNPTNNHISELLSQCTALVCYNDQVALQIIETAREKGIQIPDELSIVSFDDSQLAQASPIKLTTVAHPKEELGIQAANAIINMVERTKDYYDVKISPSLIIRGSTQKMMQGRD